jgi:hypothetical protein
MTTRSPWGRSPSPLQMSIRTAVRAFPWDVPCGAMPRADPKPRQVGRSTFKTLADVSGAATISSHACLVAVVGAVLGGHPRWVRPGSAARAVIYMLMKLPRWASDRLRIRRRDQPRSAVT